MRVDAVHEPENEITLSGKRALEQDLEMLFNGLRPSRFAWGPHFRDPLPDVHINEPASPPPNVRPPILAPAQEVHVPPQNPAAEPGHETIKVDDDAPPASPGSELSHSSSFSSTESEGWHTAPSTPGSDLESNRLSTIPNAPSTESQSHSEKLKRSRVDYEMEGETKVNTDQMKLRSAGHGDPGAVSFSEYQYSSAAVMARPYTVS